MKPEKHLGDLQIGHAELSMRAVTSSLQKPFLCSKVTVGSA